MRRLDGLESRSRILPDIQAILKWVGFAILFWGGVKQVALAQDWQTPIVLTHGYVHGAPYLVVDSLHRIHMFTIRSRDPRPGYSQPNTLVYYLFDNWGRPLRDAYEVLPDSHWMDYGEIGLLLDHQERIHVLWHRYYDSNPPVTALLYARLSLNGDFLQEPLVIANDVEEADFDLVETLSGEVWGACGAQYFAVDVDGNVVESFQNVYPSDSVRSNYLKLAAAPDGSVWGCLQTFSSGPDRIMTVRFWPTPRIEETTYMAQQVGQTQAFNIDVNGAFHYVMIRGGIGLYYRYDNRHGQITDSVVIDSSPYGAYISRLSPIAEDSLQFLWGRSLPPVGINRVCFTTDGTIGVAPTLIPHPQFGITDSYTAIHDGSYWIPGWVFGGEIACAMLHIPGANEPLAVSESPTEQASQPSLHVYPQPNLGTLYFNLPSFLKGETNLTIYNILGQQVFQTDLQAPPAVIQPSVQLPPGLASGTYLLSLSTQTQFLTSRFVLIR